ncbi:MAG: nucleotidyltransferase family protein [Pseudomonadota bacterium]
MISTAMLLAAGLGTRMRPLTDDRPKPMIELAGRSLIDHALDKLVAAGVERAIVNVHYFADKLESHLAARDDIEILISDERAELLETGGGVVKASVHFQDEPVLILNTDACWETADDTTFQTLVEAFDPETMDSLLLLADMKETLGFHGPGDFYLETDGRLTRRGERTRAPYVYAGAYVLNPGVLAGYAATPFSANAYWNESLKAGRLFGQVMSPFWMHVGDPAARDAAEARLLANAAPSA